MSSGPCLFVFFSAGAIPLMVALSQRLCECQNFVPSRRVTPGRMLNFESICPWPYLTLSRSTRGLRKFGTPYAQCFELS